MIFIYHMIGFFNTIQGPFCNRQNYIKLIFILLLSTPTYIEASSKKVLYPLCITTQNVMASVRSGEKDRKRMEALSMRLFSNKKQNLIACQEVVSQLQYKSLKRASSGYYAVQSEWSDLESFPLKAYQPSLGTSITGIITTLIAFFTNKNSIYALASLFYLLGFFLAPSIFLRLVGCYSPLVQDMVQKKADHMGLALFLDKKTFHKPQTIACRPFTKLGYTFPSWRAIAHKPYINMVQWMRTWIQIMVCRPGLLIIKTKTDHHTYCIANAHLTTGIYNPFRIEQIQELEAMMFNINADIYILCMDANADPRQKEIVYLTKHHWVDVWPTIKKNDAGYTWHTKNPYIGRNNPFVNKPQRIDYILVRTNHEVKYHQVKLGGLKEPLSDHYSLEAKINIVSH